MELLVAILTLVVVIMAILIYTQHKKIKDLRDVITKTVNTVDMINKTITIQNEALTSSHNAMQLISARMSAKEQSAQQELR